MGTHTYRHPTLNSTLIGLITGASSNVVQYRGIKFASVPSRFARSVSIDKYPESLDCTRHGPICPQEANPAFEAWLFAIPPEQSERLDLTMDEFECLNLIVNIPKELSKDERSGLPVFVFIHGGANKAGMSSGKLLDMAKLVSRSLENGTPIITVSLNYRLGLLGFGVLPDGTGANNGLFDQRLALQWVKKHIAGFGGDPNRIIVGGESAGSFGVSAHLEAKDSETRPDLQLFYRAVLMSGTMMTAPPATMESLIRLSEKYAAVIPGEGSIPDKMKSCDIRTLIKAQVQLGSGLFTYALDGDFFGNGPYVPYKTIPSWCEGILIGDCEFEAFLWYIPVYGAPADTIVRALSLLGESGKTLIDAYKISGDTIQKGTLDLITDALFIYPNYRTVETWRNNPVRKHVHQYLLDQANPWDPNGHGAHHAVDIIYLYGNYEYPNDGCRVVERQIQDDFIAFYTAEKEELDKRLGWNEKDEFRTYGGPDGNVGVCGPEGLHARRRVAVWEKVLKPMGDVQVLKAAGLVIREVGLAAARAAGQSVDGKLGTGLDILPYGEANTATN